MLHDPTYQHTSEHARHIFQMGFKEVDWLFAADLFYIMCVGLFHHSGLPHPHPLSEVEGRTAAAAAPAATD